MNYRITFVALISLLSCAACSDQSAKSASMAGAPLQYSGVQWDQIVAAQSVAHVTNDRLILQR